MVESVGHRGPDDRGEWLLPDGSVGLGHTRLAILDLEARGHQPMSEPTGHLVIAFNGEIYNYRALRQQLKADGFQFRTRTDTEVILNLWLRDGHAALGQLDGMFAFALWDTRERRLVLARDPAGIKPLYYADLDPGIVFASEIKAILQVAQVSRDLNPTALLNHLTYLWSPGPATLLAGVKKLEPGTWIEIADGRLAGVGDFRKPRQVREGVDDAPRLLRERLRQAVADQLISDVPVGAFLSGGLDSTALVALAREQLGPFDCFTISSSTEAMRAEGFVDDLPYAKLAAEALGVRLHAVRLGPEICDHVDFMVHHLDEPQADLAPLQVFAISQLARSLGVKVLLSGAGGDDILGGYRRHAATSFERWWNWVPSPLRKAAGRTTRHLPVSRPSLRRVRKALENAGLEPDDRAISHLRWIDQGTALGLLEGGLRGSILAPDAPFLQVLARLPRGATSLQKALALDETFFLVDHNLNYTDKLSMAVGLEVRVPFLAPRVLEVAHALGDRQLVRGTSTKFTLKQAVRGLVPDETIDRSKAGFGVPLRMWMHGPLRPWLDAQLDPEVLRGRGVFDANAVTRLRQNNASGSIDASYSLLAVALVERWLQLFVDQIPQACSVAPPPSLEWERVV